MIRVGNKVFTVIKDHKNGWNLEAFKDRYSEVLDRYDYIVGDWGYDQLRLKGFNKPTNARVPKETSIDLIHDYIQEYCNFGCAYFVVERIHTQDKPIES